MSSTSVASLMSSMSLFGVMTSQRRA